VSYVVADAIRADREDPGVIADALAAGAARYGLRRGDGLALLRWLLDLTGDPGASRWLEQARAHAAAPVAGIDDGPLTDSGAGARV
jgi:hypothetical protein